MTKVLHRRDLREQGWNALVAALGIVDATRFVTELYESAHDYSQVREPLFQDCSLDELYADMQQVSPPGIGD